MNVSGSLPAVISATTNDLDTIAGVLAAAHHDDPVAEWVVPDPRERPRLLHAWYTILVEHALIYGMVDMLADRSGAAVWLDRTTALPEPLDYEKRVVATCGLFGLDMLMADHVSSHHRLAAAHHHLTHIGVDRQKRRDLRLHALLDHRHTRLDAAGLAAAAEAGSEDELRLFAAYGYRLAEPYHLPDGPLLHPVLRIPQDPGRHLAPAAHDG
ncbi:N-acetyltransferase [Winogradskya humida]|uniref:N-acetyltransferase n=1 Tax=Winogradskya humida TaxID=113566 RepID=A0ABQ4A213_9ACTN|nr:N-acetyltransferase [Actinoplanes humidus]GIE24895.1 N-acetyltransferase [Actinoplanes humidus]